MDISKNVRKLIREEVEKRFKEYVQIESASLEGSDSFPSTESQLKFGELLVDELKEIGIKDITHDEFGYIYAKIPESKGFENAQSIGLVAHLDTAPTVSGKNVIPVVHKNYDGREIIFQKNEEITLSPKDSEELNQYIGYDIITGQGDTLLGADDKAGIAEILSAATVLMEFPELKHGPLVLCFFPDEELGKGTEHIDHSKLPKFCYTMDGSKMGELEIECFDAWRADIIFKGYNLHPGYAKNQMINSIHIAGKFFSDLPEEQAPEHTKEREGFFHLLSLKGNVESSEALLLIRDYNIENNRQRMRLLEQMKEYYEMKYPGIKIEIEFQHQYENMKQYLDKHPKVIQYAEQAIKMADLDLEIHSIRGGTDGAKLSAAGIPTPNIFAGGLLFHSKKEYIPSIALEKATEVILHLIDLWSKKTQ